MSGPTAAVAPPHADSAAYAAHYERENQALRGQAFGLRQLLEAKEVQAAHYSQMLATCMQEGELIATRAVALEPCLRCLSPELLHQWYSSAATEVDTSMVTPAPAVVPPSTPLGIPPPTPLANHLLPPPTPVAALPVPCPPSTPSAVPSTPSRTVLSLQQVTPGPMAGTYAMDGQTVPPTSASQALGLAAPPTPSSTLASDPVPPTPSASATAPSALRAPPSAPPVHPAPSGPLHASPEPGQPPARDASTGNALEAAFNAVATESDTTEDSKSEQTHDAKGLQA